MDQNYPTSSPNRIPPLSFDNLPSKNPQDWITVNPAQWPGTTYEESPLSSDGSGDVYSPLPDDQPWNPFEQSFANSRMAESFDGSAGEPYNTYQPMAYNARSPDPTLAPAFPYVNLSAITEDHAMIDDGLDGALRGDQVVQSSEFPSQLVRQPAWGSRRNSSTSITKSAKSKHHKRTKSAPSDHTNSASNPSSPLSPTRHKLRSTSTTLFSRPTSSYSTTASGARTNHNLVEKQYRTRLNGQFEILLQCLPREAIGGVDGEKRVSKAEVLVLAKEYIRELERKRKMLEEENFGLENAIEGFRRRWIELGGVAMP